MGMQQDKASDATEAATQNAANSKPSNEHVGPLEKSYREALAAFKNDKSNKDLRRAKSAAKKAWDEAIKATQDGEALICRDCSQLFMFSEKDQSYYLDNGWRHRPARCKKCSETSRKRLENRTDRDSKVKNMCYAFQKGQCYYGDKCKFSHDPKGVKKSDNDRGGASGEKTEKNEESTFIAQCKSGSECTYAETKPAKQKVTKKVETYSASISASKNSNEKKSVVKKAMAKALKKTPSKQLKMKELRKAVKARMAEKKKVMTNTELKDAISDALVQSKDKFIVEGKIIQLIV